MGRRSAAITSWFAAMLSAQTAMWAQVPREIDPSACWRFEIASEPGPRQPGSLIPAYALLTDLPARNPSQFAVHRIDQTGRPIDRATGPSLSSWYRLPGSDSLQVTFTEGFARYFFVVAAVPRPGSGQTDTLRGRAAYWSDDGPSVSAKGPASAVRVSCPATRGEPERMEGGTRRREVLRSRVRDSWWRQDEHRMLTPTLLERRHPPVNAHREGLRTVR